MYDDDDHLRTVTHRQGMLTTSGGATTPLERLMHQRRAWDVKNVGNAIPAALYANTQQQQQQQQQQRGHGADNGSGRRSNDSGSNDHSSANANAINGEMSAALFRHRWFETAVASLCADEAMELVAPVRVCYMEVRILDVYVYVYVHVYAYVHVYVYTHRKRGQTLTITARVYMCRSERVCTSSPTTLSTRGILSLRTPASRLPRRGLVPRLHSSNSSSSSNNNNNNNCRI